MICFAWVEFPQYGARLVGSLVEQSREEVVVVATRPRVPVQGMERYAKCRILWIERDYEGSLFALWGQVPRTLFVSGWSLPMYKRFAREVHLHRGSVISMVDNNLDHSLLDIVKVIRFTLFLRRSYDAYMVPGNAGWDFLRRYGVSASRIHKGLYAADGSLFTSGSSLSSRPKKILYVGQICDRKNIVPFARAFVAANRQVGNSWELEICGRGPLVQDLPKSDYVIINDFIQPEHLPEKYQYARIFALPSISDHWGVVVHEAALSGCALALSENVGAAADFLGHGNGKLFNPNSQVSMQKALLELMTLTEGEFDSAYKESLELGRKISIDLFVRTVKKLSGGM